MTPRPDLQRIYRLLDEARELARDDHIMVRVCGERIGVILADLLYEIDVDRDEVVSLLPPQRRAAG